MCSLFCPMLNKFGVCESTMRRVERVQECPHLKIHKRLRQKEPRRRAGQKR